MPCFLAYMRTNSRFRVHLQRSFAKLAGQRTGNWLDSSWTESWYRLCRTRTPRRTSVSGSLCLVWLPLQRRARLPKLSNDLHGGLYLNIAPENQELAKPENSVAISTMLRCQTRRLRDGPVLHCYSAKGYWAGLRMPSVHLLHLLIAIVEIVEARRQPVGSDGLVKCAG